jgi:predicted Zn-dependent protease
MDDLATAAAEAALSAGAGYADARGRRSRSELVAARNGVVEQVDREERTGVGVRALIDSSEGRESVFPVPSLHLAS